MVNGQDTQKWQLVQIIGQKTNKYTVWLTTKTNTKHKGEVDPIPVRYAGLFSMMIIID